MKVLVFTTLFPNSEAPHHATFVAARLRRLLRCEGVSAKVVAPVPWFPFRHRLFGDYARLARVPRREVWEGIEVSHPRFAVLPKVGMLAAPMLLAGRCRRELQAIRDRGFDFDVIDAHYLYPDGVAAVQLGTWLQRPVVVTARGSDVNVIAQRSRPRRSILRALKAAAATVAVSESLRSELVRLGAEPTGIRVLRNGVDLDQFRPVGREETRSRLGWQGRKLLMVARLVPGKGHLLAFDSLSALPPDVGLALVGDGPLRHALERVVSRRGMADRVAFLGARNPAEMPALYSAADALILPSEREGMPNVVLESLGCGTPVVACDVGGVGEILTFPDAGIVVGERSPQAFAAACVRILAVQPDRLAIRAQAQAFSWDTVADALAGLLRRAAMSRP